jgi:hypothetical protein
LISLWLITISLVFLLGSLPTVQASKISQDPFPDIPFNIFVDFIQDTFSSKISLATVLTILFTLTNNTDLLNLHSRQQQQIYSGEKGIEISGWIKCLARALDDKLGNTSHKLFKKADNRKGLSSVRYTAVIAEKLDRFAWLLDLTAFTANGDRKPQQPQPISNQNIEPAYVICPPVMECETFNCQPRSLLQNTLARDIPSVTLINGTTIFDNTKLLGGKCPSCNTIYYADHESTKNPDDSISRFYLNSARFLKIGQQLWVDRVFSNAVLNGMYSFHASSSAYAEFWNASFYDNQNTSARKVILINYSD